MRSTNVCKEVEGRALRGTQGWCGSDKMEGDQINPHKKTQCNARQAATTLRASLLLRLLNRLPFCFAKQRPLVALTLGSLN